MGIFLGFFLSIVFGVHSLADEGPNRGLMECFEKSSFYTFFGYGKVPITGSYLFFDDSRDRIRSVIVRVESGYFYTIYEDKTYVSSGFPYLNDTLGERFHAGAPREKRILNLETVNFFQQNEEITSQVDQADVRDLLIQEIVYRFGILASNTRNYLIAKSTYFKNRESGQNRSEWSWEPDSPNLDLKEKSIIRDAICSCKHHSLDSKIFKAVEGAVNDIKASEPRLKENLTDAFLICPFS